MAPSLPCVDEVTKTTMHCIAVMPSLIDCGELFVESDNGKYKEIKKKPLTEVHADDVISPMVEIMEVDETNMTAIDAQSLQGQSISTPTSTTPNELDTPSSGSGSQWYVPRGGSSKEIDPRKDKKDRILPNEYETELGGCKAQSVYRVRVRATNKWGISPPSPAIIVKTLEVRPKVVNVSATELRLNWSGAILEGAVVVQYKKVNDSEYKQVFPDELTKDERKKSQNDKVFTAIVSGLEAGVVYDVRLMNATDAVSESIRVQTRDKAGIKCIEAPDAKYSDDVLKLTWSTRPEVESEAEAQSDIKDWIVQDDHCSGGQVWTTVGRIEQDVLVNKKHLMTLVLDVMAGRAAVMPDGRVVRAKDGEVLGSGATNIVVKEISIGKKKASAILALAGWSGTRMFRVCPVIANQQGIASLPVSVVGRLSANVKL